jgi:hypothetical protein
VTIIGALISFGHTDASRLADDLYDAFEALGKQGGLHQLDPKRVKIGTGR